MLQVDGNYTLAASSWQEIALIYVQDDEDEVFNLRTIDFLNGSLTCRERFEASAHLLLRNDTGRAFELTQQLDLAVDEQEDNSSASRICLRHPGSRLVGEDFARSRIISISEGYLSESGPPRSRWRKRLLRVRAFLDRLKIFRRRTKFIPVLY